MPDGVAYVFGVERPHYQATRTVWGLPVVMRVLTAEEAQACDAVSDAWQAAGAQALERGIQWLARSLVSIDGNAVIADPDQRTEWIRKWPAPLVTACVEAFQTVTKEYADLLKPEEVAKSSGAAA
ncbi:MAG TPA: hypothetical protein VGP33_14710 [Chloroflexota bacterium]|nr:hypothetical protein [Chloroflexota bacterium]